MIFCKNKSGSFTNCHAQHIFIIIIIILVFAVVNKNCLHCVTVCVGFKRHILPRYLSSFMKFLDSFSSFQYCFICLFFPKQSVMNRYVPLTLNFSKLHSVRGDMFFTDIYSDHWKALIISLITAGWVIKIEEV